MKQAKNKAKKEYKEILNLTGKYLKQRKETGEKQVCLNKDIKFSQRTKVSPLPENILKKLENKLKNCQRCNLGKSRTKLVFGEGNAGAWLMFVGEGPGYDEDMQGRPFIGRAGKLLSKIIEAMEMKREEVYIGNTVKCHPMINPEQPQKRGNDRPPRPEEVAQCKPFLLKQIEIIKPKIICTLGTHATQALLETKAPIGSLRGKFHSFGNCKLMPTYHPAALLRNPAWKKFVWEDMKKIMQEHSKN